MGDSSAYYRATVAQQIAEYLAGILQTKASGHRACVADLPRSMMDEVCRRLQETAGQIESYILADEDHPPLEIGPTHLIELRNKSPRVLVILLPSGLKTAAEDSYGEHTFENISIRPALYGLRRQLLGELKPDFPYVEKIVNSPHARKRPIEDALRYLLSVQQERGDPQAAGRYLYYLGLVPDLALNREDVEARIDRNSRKIEILTRPEKPLLARIDALKLRPETIQGELFGHLHSTEGTDPDVWLPQTLGWGLTFDQWPEDIRTPDEPLVLSFDSLGKFKGMNEESGDYVAYTHAPITVSWHVSPLHPQYLGYYVLTLLREEREDEELLPPKRIAAGRRTCRVDLTGVELDEDEGRVAARLEIRAINLDSETLASDMSDPFWIEKGTEVAGQGDAGDETRRNPHGGEVRSVAEALLIGALRVRANSSRKVDVAVNYDRSTWASSSKAKGAVQDIYRVRLTTNDLFHLKFVPILRDLERRILDQSRDLCSYRLTLTSRPAAGQDIEARTIDSSGAAIGAFLDAREALFREIAQSTPAAVVEVVDLRSLGALVLEYARAYQPLLDMVPPHVLACLDTLLVEMPESQALLLAPTHPLRILWLLQYQRLLGQWTEGILEAVPDDVSSLFDRASLDRITSLNTPAFLTTDPEHVWLNTDNVNMFWSIFLPMPVVQSRETLGFLYRALSVPAGKTDASAIQADQLAARVALYLDQHPYVRTLVLNVVNPGDGALVLDTLRSLQKQSAQRELSYELRLFGEGSYDQLGLAFDDLMNEAEEGRGQDIDDAFLEAGSNPLLPRLAFAKHRPQELITAPTGARDAHLSILLDHFSSSVAAVPLRPTGGSSSLHGLLTEFQTEYGVGEGIIWSRSIQPGSCPGLGGNDAIAPLLYDLHTKLLQEAATAIPGSQHGSAPAVQLCLSPEDLTLIARVHDSSDWVLIVDRNFGIEYFDNPQPLASHRESYLIDYTPEFLSDIGHRLIVSTAWLNEIEALLARSLHDLGLLSEQLRSLDMLDALRSLSGRVALQVLSQPAHGEPLIGLGLAQRFLVKSGQLREAVLVPASAHPDLFGPDAGNTLALVGFEEGIRVSLLTVRFCRGTFIGDEYTAREEIRQESERTADWIRTRLASRPYVHLDQALRDKAWAGVLRFYWDRAIRYGFLAKDSPASLAFSEGLESLCRDSMPLVVDRGGLIFNLAGITKPAEDYHGVQLRVIGKDDVGTFGGSVPVERVQGAADVEPPARQEEQEAVVEETAQLPSTLPERVEEPPERPATIEIYLGNSTDTGRPVVWAPTQPPPRRLTNQHVLLVGKSGSGKTQSIMVFVYELWRQGVASLILDFHGEYCDAPSRLFREAIQAKVLDAAQGIPINPLALPLDPITDELTDYRNVVYQATESLSDIFRLGDIQKRLLKRAIEDAYTSAGFDRNATTWARPAPPFSQVWGELRRIEREERGTARNLVARVEPLFEAEVFRGEDQPFEEMLHQTTIVRLSSLANKELRTAISRFLLQKVYERMLALGPSEQQRLFCVVDEAHRLSHDPTLTDLIKEARKYGIGLVLSSQETRDFDRSMFANTGTLIALQLEIEDARIMAENLGLLQPTERSAAIEIILRQRPGQALMRNNHYLPYTQVQIVPLTERLGHNP